MPDRHLRLLASGPAHDPDAALRRAAALVSAILSELDPALVAVSVLRCGCDRGRPRSLEETAGLLGVSVARTRELEVRAVAVLASRLRAAGIIATAGT